MVLANPTGTWSASDGAALYGLDRWGDPYFSVSARGHVMVQPRGERGGSLEASRTGSRKVYFDGVWLDTALYTRDALPVGAKVPGPAIVTQLDTTVLIDPGSVATVDALGNLVIAVGGNHGA